jgi:hypothetical protein
MKHLDKEDIGENILEQFIIKSNLRYLQRNKNIKDGTLKNYLIN